MTQIAMKFVQWDVPELENWKIARFTNYGNVLIMATSWVGKKRTGSPAMWKSAAISKRYRFNGLPFWLLRCSQTVFRETTRTYCWILCHWQNRTTFCPIWSNWRYNRSTIKIKRSMKVTIEHSFCPYCDEVTELYFRIINTILFSGNEAELRESMRQLEKKTPLDEYFTYGYGARHLWVCQRRPSDKTKIFEHRIMMVEFQWHLGQISSTGWNGITHFSLTSIFLL